MRNRNQRVNLGHRTLRVLPRVVERGGREGGPGADAFLQYWIDRRQEIERTLHDDGAILFRGFDISDLEKFQRIMSALGSELVRYVDGNSPRTHVSGGVYTSTEYPPTYFISLHNELSYSAQWPARLFFCCLQPAETGGETPLVDSRELLQDLPADVVRDFQERRVRYIRNLHGGKGLGPSWQKTFETSERSEVERFASESGMEFEWRESDMLRLSIVRPAVALHPVTADRVWFNQADQFHPSTHPTVIRDSMLSLYKGREDALPQHVTYGDGTPIPVGHLDVIREVTRRRMTLFRWQRGDLLMVDNMLVAHGRMPFTGPRTVLVAMTAR
jgi:alpha-ketoglutarate-dependent taurine dioxygenase